MEYKSDKKVSVARFDACWRQCRDHSVRHVPALFIAAVKEEYPELLDPGTFPTLAYLAFGSHVHRDIQMLQLSYKMLAYLQGALTPAVLLARKFSPGMALVRHISYVLGPGEGGGDRIRIRRHQKGVSPCLLERFELPPRLKLAVDRCRRGEGTPEEMTRMSTFERFDGGGFRAWKRPAARAVAKEHEALAAAQRQCCEMGERTFGATLEVQQYMNAFDPNAFSRRVNQSFGPLMREVALRGEAARQSAGHFSCPLEQREALEAAERGREADTRRIGGLVQLGTPQYGLSPRSARIFPRGGSHPGLLARPYRRILLADCAELDMRHLYLALSPLVLGGLPLLSAALASGEPLWQHIAEQAGLGALWHGNAEARRALKSVIKSDVVYPVTMGRKRNVARAEANRRLRSLLISSGRERQWEQIRRSPGGLSPGRQICDAAIVAELLRAGDDFMRRAERAGYADSPLGGRIALHGYRGAADHVLSPGDGPRTLLSLLYSLAEMHVLRSVVRYQQEVGPGVLRIMLAQHDGFSLFLPEAARRCAGCRLLGLVDHVSSVLAELGAHTSLSCAYVPDFYRKGYCRRCASGHALESICEV